LVLQWGSHFHDSPYSVVVLPEGLKIESATGGLNHSLALTSCGRIFSWGEKKAHQLGRSLEEGEDGWKPGEVYLGTKSRIVQVACGAYHSAVLTEDGQVWTWGDEDIKRAEPNTPEKVTSDLFFLLNNKVDLDEKVIEISCGFSQTYALTEDKKVFGNLLFALCHCFSVFSPR
jgi:alpha-tubulin suppressor-like RCC1 family protein